MRQTAALLSWLAGYLVVVAPAGAGAREATYVALLGAYHESGAVAGALASGWPSRWGEAAVLVGPRLARHLRSRARVGGDVQPGPESGAHPVTGSRG